MTTTKDGGPAFPPNAGWRDNDPACRGMTLRDWFAAHALAGMLADRERDGGYAAFATDAYGFADAMLANRERVE